MLGDGMTAAVTPGRGTSRSIRFGAFALAVVLGMLAPTNASATIVNPRSGPVDLAYSYPGTIATTDCSNPARGAGFYGDLFKVSSSTPVKIYMMEGTLGDPFLQILDSDRVSVLQQDDDSGSDDNGDGRSYSSYIDAALVSTGQYIVATTFGAGGLGSYTLYSSVPLTQVTACPQVITFDSASSVAYGNSLSVTASTNMSLPVTLTSLTPSICSVTASR